MLFTKLDAIKAITKIRVNFPNAFPTEDDEQEQLLIETWYECLEEYPAELVAKALKESIKTAKFPPRLGDITEKIEEMREAYEKSDAELWAELTGVLREVERCAYSFRYTYVDESGISQGDQARRRVAQIFYGLSPELQNYCRNSRGLIELSQYTADQLSYERGRFMRNMPQLRKSQRIRGNMDAGLAQLIQGVSEHLQIETNKQKGGFRRMKHTKGDLQQMQSLPLSAKILMTKRRIRDWYDYWGGQVYVSFSGGKDSTVLLHIAREVRPDIEAVFVNTGLEYPEIQKFVKTFDNVTILRPKMRFDEVVRKYGYPIISKVVGNCVVGAKRKKDGVKYKQICGVYETNGKLSKFNYGKYKPLLDVDFNVSDECCAVMKKEPMKEFAKYNDKKPIIATMACESENREMVWLRTGCNAFESKNPQSKPMSFWTEQDVLQYIKENNIPIASVYGDIAYKGADGNLYLDSICDDAKLCTTGCHRTGCIFCGFGAHLDEKYRGRSRFEILKETHPRQYDYCIGGGEYVNGVWQPNKKGLGMGHVFDELNKIYGDGFIKY